MDGRARAKAQGPVAPARRGVDCAAARAQVEGRSEVALASFGGQGLRRVNDLKTRVSSFGSQVDGKQEKEEEDRFSFGYI